MYHAARESSLLCAALRSHLQLIPIAPRQLLCLIFSWLSSAERSGQCVRSCSVAVAGRSCSQSLASAHTAVRLQSDRKTRPFGITESSCGRCGLVESPQPPERNTKHSPHSIPTPSSRLFDGVLVCGVHPPALSHAPLVQLASTQVVLQGGRVEKYLELRAAEGAAIR